jgi:hypothetical protein
MGDQVKLDTMLEAFRVYITYKYGNVSLPQFDRGSEYFIIRKGDELQEAISDEWDAYQAGWLAREGVDERTVKGW